MARTAMITGATGRIGAAVARLLAAEGWSLVLHHRAATGAAALAAAFPGARVAAADLAVTAEVRALAARAADVDALVHCAGRFREAPLLEEDASAWRVDVAVEAEALHALAVACVPGMRARGFGRIVALGLAGLERWPGYRTSTGHAVGKAAMMIVARGLAHELVDDPITVNVVAPGVVGDGAPAALVGRVEPRTPEAIAEIVRFLLSDAAAAVTGAFVPAGAPLGLTP